MIDPRLQTVLICALRHALHDRSELTAGPVCAEIMERWHCFDRETRRIIKGDIQDAIEKDEMHPGPWVQVLQKGK